MEKPQQANSINFHSSAQVSRLLPHPERRFFMYAKTIKMYKYTVPFAGKQVENETNGQRIWHN